MAVFALVATVWASLCCADPIQLMGKVVDEAGEPVVGADIWIWDGQQDRNITARSEATGGFQLEFEGDPSRAREVFAVAAGRAVGVHLVSPDRPEPFEIALEPESHVKGFVRDSDGKPVQGAEVALFTYRPAGSPGRIGSGIALVGHDPPVRCATNAQGRFVLGNLPRGAEVDIRVMAGGFANWRSLYYEGAERAVGGAEADYLVELQPEIVIEGTVTHDGEPVAGVEVCAQGIHPTSWWGEALTDGKGHYRLDGLGAGTYNVMMRDLVELVAPGHDRLTARPMDVVRGIDFALTEGGIIEGRFIDGETGEGIPGATVGGYGPARPTSGAACMGAVADENGEYRLRVAPGRNMIYCGAPPGYFRPKDARRELDVGEGQTVRAPDFVLQGTASFAVEVEVIGPDGEPVAGVEVERLTEPGAALTTDQEGRCTVTVGSGKSLVLLARDRDRGLAGAAEIMTEDEPPVRLQLAPCASVSLHLVDPQGQPLPNITTTTFAAPTRASAPFAARPLARATSDGDGLVRLGDLPAGCTLHFSVDRRTARPIEWPEDLRLAAGQTHEVGDIALDIEFMAVSGTVLLPDQAPVEGAVVRAMTRQHEATHTDAEGRFTIKGLVPSDKVVIFATSADGKLVGAEVLAPEWELEPGIILAPPVRARLRLVDAEGKPVARRKVRVGFSDARSGVAREIPEAFTGEDGRAVIEGLVPDLSYGLLVYEAGMSPMRATWQEEFTPEPGGDCDLGDIQVREP